MALSGAPSLPSALIATPLTPVMASRSLEVMLADRIPEPGSRLRIFRSRIFRVFRGPASTFTPTEGVYG